MVSFQIKQLRAKNAQTLLEIIVVLLACVFVTIFLPQILFKFIYANQQLTEEPALLGWIPTLSFAVGLIFTVYGLLTNLMRERKITQLSSELMTLAGNMNSPAMTPGELAELEKVVDDALNQAAAAPTTTTKQKRRGRPAKKSSK